MKKKKVLITLGGGGHTAQMIELTKQMGKSLDYMYVINHDDRTSREKIIFSGNVYQLIRPRGINQKSRIKNLITTSVAIIQAGVIIVLNNPCAIISAGPGIAVPLFLWGKILRKKTIFIESWSRVKTKSLTGKLCENFSTKIFVQWPKLKHKYSNAIYAGRLG